MKLEELDLNLMLRFLFKMNYDHYDHKDIPQKSANSSSVSPPNTGVVRIFYKKVENYNKYFSNG